MRFIRNLKLKYKVIIMALIPVAVMCLVAIILNNTVIKDALLDETKSELRATSKSVVSAYDQNTGDYFMNSTGDVWKGSYNVSLSETFIDDLSEKTGLAVTFFYGDQRLVTSLKDSDGKRLTGSKAGDFLVKNVLKNGNEVFTNRVKVENTWYFGYYVPVYQNDSDEIIGMVFTGMPVSRVEKQLNTVTRIFVIAIIIILLLTIILAGFVAQTISNGINESVKVVEKIADGELNVPIKEKALKRKDEVGKLSNGTKLLKENLGGLIGSISDNAMNLNASAQEMSVVATQASQAMDEISENLQEILDGAGKQAENTQNVNGSVRVINDMLCNTMDEIGNLKNSTDIMMKSSVDVEKQLNELNYSNDEVLKAIGKIAKQTQETSHSVVNIIESIGMINDIVEETNLLSLNASIEAARAGESGKGFAVVAQEINALANQSGQVSSEISEMVKQLNYNSEQSIEIMKTVKKVIDEQNQNVNATIDVFGKVKSNIGYVLSGVDKIKESTTKLGKETDVITTDVTTLDNIAKENEQRVENTMKSGNEVLDVVEHVRNMSVEVSNSANEMAENVNKFKF